MNKLFEAIKKLEAESNRGTKDVPFRRNPKRNKDESKRRVAQNLLFLLLTILFLSSLGVVFFIKNWAEKEISRINTIEKTGKTAISPLTEFPRKRHAASLNNAEIAG